MSGGLGLDGRMIPRQVKRMFDQRDEPRDTGGASAVLIWRGRLLPVELVNVSESGAMVGCEQIPHIGEAMAIQLPDGRTEQGVIRWVRDGRIGIHFVARLG